MPDRLGSEFPVSPVSLKSSELADIWFLFYPVWLFVSFTLFGWCDWWMWRIAAKGLIWEGETHEYRTHSLYRFQKNRFLPCIRCCFYSPTSFSSDWSNVKALLLWESAHTPQIPRPCWWCFSLPSLSVDCPPSSRLDLSALFRLPSRTPSFTS